MGGGGDQIFTFQRQVNYLLLMCVYIYIQDRKLSFGVGMHPVNIVTYIVQRYTTVCV